MSIIILYIGLKKCPAYKNPSFATKLSLSISIGRMPISSIVYTCSYISLATAGPSTPSASLYLATNNGYSNGASTLSRSSLQVLQGPIPAPMPNLTGYSLGSPLVTSMLS